MNFRLLRTMKEESFLALASYLLPHRRAIEIDDNESAFICSYLYLYRLYRAAHFTVHSLFYFCELN